MTREPRRHLRVSSLRFAYALHRTVLSSTPRRRGQNAQIVVGDGADVWIRLLIHTPPRVGLQLRGLQVGVLDVRLDRDLQHAVEAAEAVAHLAGVRGVADVAVLRGDEELVVVQPRVQFQVQLEHVLLVLRAAQHHLVARRVPVVERPHQEHLRHRRLHLEVEVDHYASWFVSALTLSPSTRGVVRLPSYGSVTQPPPTRLFLRSDLHHLSHSLRLAPRRPWSPWSPCSPFGCAGARTATAPRLVVRRDLEAATLVSQ